jgi:hypothetical protein
VPVGGFDQLHWNALLNAAQHRDAIRLRVRQAEELREVQHRHAAMRRHLADRASDRAWLEAYERLRANWIDNNPRMP